MLEVVFAFDLSVNRLDLREKCIVAYAASLRFVVRGVDSANHVGRPAILLDVIQTPFLAHAHAWCEQLPPHTGTAAPNQVWTTDIMYLATAEGWVYLSVIIGLFSKQVVGWSMPPHMKVELVTDALRMAWFRRRPDAGVIVHSDRGSQYCSGLFRDTLKADGMRSSMSRRGDCWDTRSKIASERRTDLTRAGIGRAALELTCRSSFGVPRALLDPASVT